MTSLHRDGQAQSHRNGHDSPHARQAQTVSLQVPIDDLEAIGRVQPS